MKAFLRYFHTIRHLESRQLAALVVYTVRRRLAPVLPPSPRGRVLPARGIRLPPPSPRASCFVPPGRFTFQGLERDLGERIDWAAGGVPRLWRYHLHYFDALRQPDLSVAEGGRLIVSWIQGNGGGCSHAGGPHPPAT